MHFSCPYCGRDQVATPGQKHNFSRKLDLNHHKYGVALIDVNAVACSNPDCGELTLQADLISGSDDHNGRFTAKSFIDKWKLRPRSFARPQPPCVPAALAQDYYEACAIRDLSPKASATLSRRCIQGMIHDFCNISKATLFAEITELRARVADGNAPAGVLEDTLESIDAVRSIGNIGAHMDRDINNITDVDPDEAQTLIELVELLFADWYIAREERQSRLSRVKSIADAKKAARRPAQASTGAVDVEP